MCHGPGSILPLVASIGDVKMISRYVKFLCILLLAFFVFPSLSSAAKPIFQFLRSIGGDRENYMFARITSVAISNRKEIFVSDIKFMTLRKYGWDGKFIAKAGQKGKGPGDFLSFSGLQWFDNKLLVYDLYNRRIAITDEKMKVYNYIKTDQLGANLKGPFPLRDLPITLDNNRMLGINSRYDDEIGRLFIVDKKKKSLHHFFCRLPKDIADEKRQKFFNPLTLPIVGINHRKKQMQFCLFLHLGLNKNSCFVRIKTCC